MSWEQDMSSTFDRWGISSAHEEPEYPEFDGEGTFDLEKLITWSKWAKNRIETLETINLTEIQGRQRAETTIAEQSEAIKGYEAWQRRKKSGIEVWEIGQRVLINEPSIYATITAVHLTDAGVRYVLQFWDKSQLCGAILPQSALTLQDDHLPIPGKEDMVVASTEQEMLDKLSAIAISLKHRKSGI
jgi:hypothetical protein